MGARRTWLLTATGMASVVAVIAVGASGAGASTWNVKRFPTAGVTDTARKSTRTTQPTQTTTTSPTSQTSSGASVVGPTTASFLDSLGVNVHMSYSDTPYASVATVKGLLQQAGIFHVRDGLVPDRSDQVAADTTLGEAGIGVDLIVGNATGTTLGSPAAWKPELDQLAPYTDSFEGPNEDDIRGADSWGSDLQTFMTGLRSVVSGDPSLAVHPLAAPALAFVSSAAGVGDMSSLVDLGNLHSYAGGQMPEPVIAAQLPEEGTISGSKPVIVTESGYQTTMSNTADQPPIAASLASAYTLRTYLENFRMGVPRTYAYELINTNSSASDEDFGLVTNSGTPKPAFQALGAMTSILRSAGTSASGAALQYSLSAPSTVHQLLLTAANGRSVLILWNAVSTWNTSTLTATNPAPVSASLSLGSPAQVTSYRPVLGAAATGTTAVQGSTAISVGADPVILEIQPTV
jgi:hypothetical protein